MRAGKEMAHETDEFAKALGFGSTTKRKTRKEEQIDRKIELLLDTYKKQDEEIVRRAHEKEVNKHINKKILRDKFGFSDDEEDQEDGEDSSHRHSKHRLPAITGANSASMQIVKVKSFK